MLLIRRLPMELHDVIWDLCFFLLGIACTAYIIRKRKHFDLRISFPVCAAWVLKGISRLYYDWVIIAVKNVYDDWVFSFMVKAHKILNSLDTLVFLLLCVALLRLINQGIYSRRYNKAMKRLNK